MPETVKAPVVEPLELLTLHAPSVVERTSRATTAAAALAANMMSATFMTAVRGARGLPGLGSPGVIQAPWPATAARPPRPALHLAPSSQATAHQPRDGGRPDETTGRPAPARHRWDTRGRPRARAVPPSVDPDVGKRMNSSASSDASRQADEPSYAEQPADRQFRPSRSD